MKISAQKLSDFLTLVAMSGELEATEAILTGDTKHLVVLTKPSKTGAVVVRAELDGDFSSIGIAGLANITLFNKFLKAFKGDVEITKTPHSLELSDGKKRVEVELKSPALQYVMVVNGSQFDHTKWAGLRAKTVGNEFTLTPVDVAELADYYSAFGKDIVIEGENSEIKFNLTSGDDKLKLNVTVPETVKKFKTKVAGLILTVFGFIKDNTVTLSANDTATGVMAILVASKGKDYSIEYIVAPMKVK